MDNTHLHLLLNHFPIIGTMIGVGLMAYGYSIRKDSIKKAALLLWFTMALSAIPVFLTGEPAEERVEGLAGVSEAVIEPHEEAAVFAFWCMEALGFLSLLALFLKFERPNVSKIAMPLIVALSLVTSGLMAYTGYLGGQIRHTEIRSATTAQTPMENDKGQDDD
jgi:uncharacterized membrane protein